MSARGSDFGEERWLPIPEWEGYYEVSDQGRVRSLDRIVVHKNGFRQRIHGRLLKFGVHDFGYFCVHLRAAPRTRSVTVHRLVLSTFVGPRPTLECRHLNGDPKDNRLENLAWGTRSENMQDAVRHGTLAAMKKTHCKHGHPLSGENMFIDCLGRRICKTCRSRVYAARQARLVRERRAAKE